MEHLRKEIAAALNRHCPPDVVNAHMEELMPVLSPPYSGELARAIVLANRILDRPSGDPDDDLAVLSRQLLRVLGRI